MKIIRAVEAERRQARWHDWNAVRTQVMDGAS